MDYKKLKLRIKEIYDVQPQLSFADAMEMSPTALNLRLNNKTQWKTPEIIKACELLNIPLEEAHTYFFNQKL